MTKKPFYVYYVPKTHHDLGYTHTIDELLTVYSKYYDDVLSFCDATADYPYEAQYRYTVECFWSLDYYLKHTGEENREKIKKYVREGRIEIQAFYANVIDGICSEEEIARMIYPAAAFAKECGVKLKSAALTDIPGLSSGVVKAMAKAEIPYFFAGFPTYFEWKNYMNEEIQTANSFWDEEKLFGWGHPAAFHWEVKGGERIFAWYQYGYGYMGGDIRAGLEAEDYNELQANLPGYIEALKAKGVPYGVMRYVDHGLDNAQPMMNVSDVVKEWNEKNEDIKCVVATEAMFFEALEADCRDKDVVTLYGELPHTDYTTLSLTEAQITGTNNHTKHKLNRLEKLQTISKTDPEIDRKIGEIYNDIMLYDEHCFGMENYGYETDYNRSIKVNYAFRAARDTDILRRKIEEAACKEGDGISVFALSGIEGDAISQKLVCAKKGSYQKVVSYCNEDGKAVLAQTDVVEEFCLPYYGLQDLHALKRTDHDVVQYTFAVAPSGNISAEHYKPCENAHKENPFSCTDSVLENAYYKICADENGKITVYDKELGQYISDDAHSMGEVLCRDVENNVMYTQTVTKVSHRMSGPVADSLVVKASCYSMPVITCEIILYHTMKRVDFHYKITVDSIPMREAFVLFPFANREPEFTYQGIGTTVAAFDEIVPGANTNQYACQHWCKVKGADFDSVLAMDEGRIIEVGGIHPTAVSQAHHHLEVADWEKPYITKGDIQKGYVTAMILYNNCQTNFPYLQQGEVIYRFSVTDGKTVNPEAFAENFVYAPIVLDGETKNRLYRLKEKNIVVTTVKQAEDGNGIIIRLRECDGVKTEVDVKGAIGKDVRVISCTLDERDVKDTNGTVTVKPYQTETVRILL